MRYYAGIGSRSTPLGICAEMTMLAHALANQGYVLRSGHADGADMAFEQGALYGKREIFIPWHKFNGADSKMHFEYIVPNLKDEWIQESVDKYHPAPHNLTDGARRLMGRNACQILGLHGVTPVDFVICWTNSAGLNGGTSQAMRISMDHKIPIMNMAHEQFNTAKKILAILEKAKQ